MDACFEERLCEENRCYPHPYNSFIKEYKDLDMALRTAGQLHVTLLLQPLLQSSKAAESKTDIHCHSGTSFICLPFLHTRAVFPSLRRYVGIHHFLQSEWHPVAVLTTSRARCHWLGEIHLLPTQTRPEQLLKQAKYENTGRGQRVCVHSHYHTFREAQNR